MEEKGVLGACWEPVDAPTGSVLLSRVVPTWAVVARHIAAAVQPGGTAQLAPSPFSTAAPAVRVEPCETLCGKNQRVAEVQQPAVYIATAHPLARRIFETNRTKLEASWTKSQRRAALSCLKVYRRARSVCLSIKQPKRWC